MKWEYNIKNTLERRTIKPSEQSWDHLAARLDVAQEKKNKLGYWWAGIAAGLIIILFTVSIFFQNSHVELQQPVLVETPTRDIKQELPMEKSLKEEQWVGISNQEGDIAGDSIGKITVERVKNPSKLRTSIEKDVVAANTNSRNRSLTNQPSSEKESFETDKISGIVAQVANLKDSGNSVTDADIDALLSSAKQEIAFQHTANKGFITVDANALLQDIEMDLQKSFRNKVFEGLKNSYEIVKTAVAERHN